MFEEQVYRLMLFSLLLVFFLIRLPYFRKSKRGRPRSVKDVSLVLLNWMGMVVFPLTYVFTDFFDFGSLSFPWILRLFGAALYSLALMLIFWAHQHLGRQFSILLNKEKKHRLVKTGPYRFVRHPMYTAFFGLVFGQLFLSSNLFIGAFGLLAWTLLYSIRVPEEEKLMLAEFGGEYREYMEGTGRVVPLRV